MDCCIPSSSPMWPVDEIFVPPCRRHLFVRNLCRDTISAQHVRSSGIRCCWPGCLIIYSLSDDLRDPALSTDSFRRIWWRLNCFQSTVRTSSALHVLHSMRYINLRLTYLLTYIPNKYPGVKKYNVQTLHALYYCQQKSYLNQLRSIWQMDKCRLIGAP